MGIGPARGFYGEEFPQNTYRAEMAGETLALGWKLLVKK